MFDTAKEWSKEWLKYVEPEKVTLFPLQLANCDRLEKNKAVYIFDEVGSGKTISAGLMTLHYLYNNPGTKILVITTSQLAGREKEPGPFKQEWLDKLPFHRWLYERQITVINHDYRNIKKVNGREPWKLNSAGDNWDLVIIDEAHVFLNSENRRHKELIGGEKGGKIRAQKVVFLTATPIKEKLSDLLTYSGLAKKITHSEGPNTNKLAYHCFDSADMKAILAPTAKQQPIFPEKLICATFDVARPFTRYFKDTVRTLNPYGSKKLFPRRRLAKTWMCERGNRQKMVLKKIVELYNKDPQKNRFVIFVRWVKENSIDPGCSAEELEKYFTNDKNGIAKFEKWERGCQEKSVEVVTGTNHKLLSDYRDPDPSNLPTVLIINYQIGEQGVNLPGYNHVINYHIPASPASLEQRFGRIDRLDSTSEEINIYFPLLKSDCDSSTINFYIAVSTYLRHFLPALPSRNSILTEEILDVYEEHSKDMQEQADKIRMIRDQWRTDKRKGDLSWAKILKYLDGAVSDDDLDQNEREVANFILGADKTIDTDQPESDRIKRLINICNDRLKEIDDSAVPHERIEAARKFIGQNGDEIGNLIFYYADQLCEGLSQEEILKNLKTISPSEDGCAGLIRNTSNYKDFIKQLKKLLLFC